MSDGKKKKKTKQGLRINTQQLEKFQHEISFLNILSLCLLGPFYCAFKEYVNKENNYNKKNPS